MLSGPLRHGILRNDMAAVRHCCGIITCHAAALLLPQNISHRLLRLQSACQWPHAAQYAAHGWYLSDTMQTR